MRSTRSPPVRAVGTGKITLICSKMSECWHGHADIFGTRAIVKNSNQSLRLRKWQRLEKDRLNEREDGDVAPNSERQSQYANEKKSRGLYKCSRRIAQIGDEIFHRFVSCSLLTEKRPSTSSLLSR